MVGSNGLGPIFGYLNVVGGDMAIFSLALCKVSYFDSHYHSYVVLVTQQRSFFSICKLFDHNVYHGHTLGDRLT